MFVFGGGNSQVGYPQKTRPFFVISWDAMRNPSQTAGSSSDQDDMTWVDICFVHIVRGSLNYVQILGWKSKLMLKSMVILRDLTQKIVHCLGPGVICLAPEVVDPTFEDFWDNDSAD